MRQLEGKVALISGAAHGQGAAEALLFASEGARLVLGDIDDAAGRAVAERIGPAAAYVHLDVTSEADWAAAVQVACERFGQLDILINNAGITSVERAIETTTRAVFMQLVEVNQLGVFLGMQAAAPALKRQGGAIVNISSAAGLRGSNVSIGYSGTKWAVRGMSKSAALELAPFGIRVNSVHPGVIETEMTRSFIEEGRLEPHRMRTPLQRFGDAEEVARMVLFLASDASSYCTGAEFVVDGGMTCG